MRTPRYIKRRKWVGSNMGINPSTPPLVDNTRERVAKLETDIVAHDPRVPQTPITCAGTSFQCDVEGSGNQPIKDVPTRPTPSDILATEITEGGMSGTNFQPDFILNWNNNSVATGYTKCSLKNTYGFENFQ